jgi:hypothetical protein
MVAVTKKVSRGQYIIKEYVSLEYIIKMVIVSIHLKAQAKKC